MRIPLYLLAVVLAVALIAPAVRAGPCTPDLPCPRHGAKPPWAAQCHRTTANSCWLYRPGWTCNALGIENDQLVVDEDLCDEVFWNPDGYKQFRRIRWKPAA